MTSDEQTNEIVELNSEETKAVVGGAGAPAGAQQRMQPVSVDTQLMSKVPGPVHHVGPAPGPVKRF